MILVRIHNLCFRSSDARHTPDVVGEYGDDLPDAEVVKRTPAINIYGVPTFMVRSNVVCPHAVVLPMTAFSLTMFELRIPCCHGHRHGMLQINIAALSNVMSFATSCQGKMHKGHIHEPLKNTMSNVQVHFEYWGSTHPSAPTEGKQPHPKTNNQDPKATTQTKTKTNDKRHLFGKGRQFNSHGPNTVVVRGVLPIAGGMVVWGACMCDNLHLTLVFFWGGNERSWGGGDKARIQGYSGLYRFLSHPHVKVP